MSITLTMQFNSLDELSAFLAANPGAAATKVASAQPSPAPAAPAPEPVATVTPISAAAPAAPAPAAAEEVDLTALRADLMGKLRSLAEGMDDPAPIAAFINSFGVPKFSELGDESLQTFATQLKEQFGV